MAPSISFITSENRHSRPTGQLSRMLQPACALPSSLAGCNQGRFRALCPPEEYPLFECFWSIRRNPTYRPLKFLYLLQILVDWILEQTTRAGIVGATVFLATKAIDQHRKYHAAQFVELADETMAVTVAADDAKIDARISNLARSSTPLCYTRVPVEYGTLEAS